MPQAAEGIWLMDTHGDAGIRQGILLHCPMLRRIKEVMAYESMEGSRL